MLVVLPTFFFGNNQIQPPTPVQHPHMPPDRHDPKSGPLKVRQRNQRACAPCRKRKVKCDGADPCGTCVGYNYECVYVEKVSRSSQTGGLAGARQESMFVNNASGYLAPSEPAAPVSPTHRVNVPYMAEETIVSESGGNEQPLRAVKTRFTSAYSAIAWPRRLGTSLGVSTPPRLQAFGWNPGIRAEQNHVPQMNICQIIELEEMRHFAAIYFKEVHPFFDILEQATFLSRSTEFWTSAQKGTDFEACICGVVALGSYFSTTGTCQAEAQVVEQGRLLLDLSTTYAPAMLSVKHVVAWILRGIYLRLTTRPHLSWMASCTAVHIAESIGLHREISEIQMARNVSSSEIDLRRKTFWVAMALNEFFSIEYGRSQVVLESISCSPLTEGYGLTFGMVTILQCVPSQSCLGNISKIIESLIKAMDLPAKSPFLALLKADACFCIYRMLCSTSSRLPAEQIPIFLEVVRVALDGNKFLRSLNQPWWNIVSTPFHAVCVLLSIGTSASLEMVPITLDVMKNITDLYNSHLSKEALKTALSLVQGARDKRRTELDCLDRGLRLLDTIHSPAVSGFLPAVDKGDWQTGNDMHFPDFLDLTNYYSFDGESFQ